MAIVVAQGETRAPQSLGGRDSRPSDAGFRALAAMMPGRCWLADAAGRTTWTSRAGPPPLPCDLPGWTTAIAACRTFEAALRIDGAVRLCRLSPLRETGGAVTGWCGLEVDIDHARCREQLADSDAMLGAFMTHAPFGMHLKDADGRYLKVNDELAAAIGRPADEIVGQSPAELFITPVAERIAAMDATAAAGVAVTEELLIEPRDRYASVLAVTFPTPGGHAVRTGGFTIDLTQRKAAEAALERSRDALFQSEKMSALGSLLAGVSHELNNPLSIVVAQAVMMERQAAGTELAERAFKIRKAADRCARIVQTFLAMARQKTPARTAVDLNAVANGAIELANYGLRADGVGITRAFAPGLPRIAADGDQLHQIVTNLIVNAQQAMAGERSLRWLEVRTARGPEANTVILEVADSGPGIPVELRRRIFEPFYTTKPQGEGTGVGLSFSQGLAEAHGGHLTLVPCERGATFRLTLPIIEKKGATQVAPAPLALPTARVRRALIVDDEEEIAASLADFLSIEGYECEVVVGGAAAQARLAAGGSYDLVVSDIRMPDVDGPALYAWIGERRPELTACTAFTTGDTLGAHAARFLATAKRPVLEKPFMPESVRHFLAEMAAR
ncbi:ATP-binding protein [Sphingomonas bacterium]|uniref:hybrid sensor histidine kinase/response regulator n=1 Tax=Sphingomonas bacterium TaxID=1895847 RepID=UPI002624899E|nr:ATP-binding protein [Sphingomonas bacterium]